MGPPGFLFPVSEPPEFDWSISCSISRKKETLCWLVFDTKESRIWLNQDYFPLFLFQERNIIN